MNMLQNIRKALHFPSNCCSGICIPRVHATPHCTIWSGFTCRASRALQGWSQCPLLTHAPMHVHHCCPGCYPVLLRPLCLPICAALCNVISVISENPMPSGHVHNAGFCSAAAHRPANLHVPSELKRRMQKGMMMKGEKQTRRSPRTEVCPTASQGHGHLDSAVGDRFYLLCFCFCFCFCFYFTSEVVPFLPLVPNCLLVASKSWQSRGPPKPKPLEHNFPCGLKLMRPVGPAPLCSCTVVHPDCMFGWVWLDG